MVPHVLGNGVDGWKAVGDVVRGVSGFGEWMGRRCYGSCRAIPHVTSLGSALSSSGVLVLASSSQNGTRLLARAMTQ